MGSGRPGHMCAKRYGRRRCQAGRRASARSTSSKDSASMEVAAVHAAGVDLLGKLDERHGPCRSGRRHGDLDLSADLALSPHSSN